MNDIKVYLTWDTDRTDVDLWVLNPAGEKIFYSHKQGKGGDALFDDVTTGYGPESYSARQAAPGKYLVSVNYYGTSRDAFAEARGEVTVVLRRGHGAGEAAGAPLSALTRRARPLLVAAIEVQ